MTTTDPYADYLEKSTAFKAAPYGVAGSGGLLDYLGPIYQAVLPNAPAGRLLNTIVQTRNIRKYNKALQDQAVRDYADKVTGQKQVGQALAQALNNPKLEQEGYKGDTAAIPDMLQAIGGINYGDMATEMAGGKPLNTYGKYMPANELQGTLNPYLKQQSDAVNYATQNGGLGAIQQGQMQSMTLPGQLPSGGGQGQAPGQSGGQPGNTLSTGVSQTAAFTPQSPIPLNINPYLLPTDVPTNTSQNQRAGLNDAQTAMSQKETGRHNTVTEGETGRHNKAEEKIGQTNAAANTERANKYQPGGGNPYTIPNAQQTHIQNQINAIDKKLKTMGYVESGGSFKKVEPNSPPMQLGPFALGGHTQTPDEEAAQSLMDQRDELYSLINPSTFGGTSKEKVVATGQKAAGIQAGQSKSIPGLSFTP